MDVHFTSASQGSWKRCRCICTFVLLGTRPHPNHPSWERPTQEHRTCAAGRTRRPPPVAMCARSSGGLRSFPHSTHLSTVVYHRLNEHQARRLISALPRWTLRRSSSAADCSQGPPWTAAIAQKTMPKPRAPCGCTNLAHDSWRLGCATS